MWKFDYEGINSKTGGYRNHTNTPVYRDGSLFAGNGYGQIGVKLKLNSDGSAPSVVWKNPEINPSFRRNCLLGNYLYSSTHDSNSKGRWICVDWTTGKTMWITANGGNHIVLPVVQSTQIHLPLEFESWVELYR